MNILPLVFTVLLVLALFTNAQHENYKRFIILKHEYEEYMQNREREYFNTRQKALYAANSKSENGTGTQRPSCRRINFKLILDKKQREANDNLYKQHRFVAMELMRILYQNSEFFQELEKKRPNFLDQLMDRLIAVSEKKELKFVQNMEALDLQDGELQTAFYHMMNGIAKSEPSQNDTQKHIPARKKNEENVDELEGEAAGEAEEDLGENPLEDHQAEQGAVSLREFIHFRQGSKKIQIYSAPRELLLAIFEGGAATVDQIIQMRENIFDKKVERGLGEQQLMEFKSKLKPEVKEDIVDFKPTTTNPRKFK